ncbi:MAG: hypothetical protein ACON47_03250 [Flavobacteriaceae bacterium]
MEELPKFLIADTSSQPETLYVIHTAYPRFCLNVSNDVIVWMEEFQPADEKELEALTPNLIEEALAFYDQEMEALE